MTDQELQGQVTTFMLAGHETTATALTWTLWLLSRHATVQSRLRAEVRAARAKAQREGRDELTYDELNSLEYLEAVVRESLRLECPVPSTIRCAGKDSVVPLSQPVTLKSGKQVTSVPLKKGTTIFLSMVANNFSEDVFGAQPTEFRPERWLEGKVGEKVQGVGVYSQLLTFLAGPRACIGYRFSLAELKAILVVLLDDFEFRTRDADSGPEIERRSTLVSRPIVKEEYDLGFRMPLRVRAVKKDDV